MVADDCERLHLGLSKNADYLSAVNDLHQGDSIMRKITDPRIEKAHTVDLQVGKRVRERRKGLRVSQMQLALKLGLTFQQVQKYEVGSNRISASKLFDIGQALQTPVSWFFEGLDVGNEASTIDAGSPVDAFLQSTEGIDLAEALAVRNAEQRRQLLDLMRQMASRD